MLLADKTGGNMKKIIIIISTFVVVLSLCACEKDFTPPIRNTSTKYYTTSTTSTTDSTLKTTKSQSTIINLTETTTDLFVVTDVMDTYLELQKIIGKDVEKSIYCCDYGDLELADEMHFKVGDEVTIRYDKDMAETYPLQLTVREIYPAQWN